MAAVSKTFVAASLLAALIMLSIVSLGPAVLQ